MLIPDITNFKFKKQVKIYKINKINKVRIQIVTTVDVELIVPSSGGSLSVMSISVQAAW